MHRLFCLALICGAAGAALAGEESAGGIKAGEEVLLLADGPGAGAQATPAVALGKDVYLAVWREGWSGKGGTARVYAARLDKAGKPLDAKGIEVAPCKEGFQEAPRVAFGGGSFLVVWQDFRNGKDMDVLGARVSPEGKVLDAQPIAIAAGPRTQALPDVASDGNSFLVAWQGIEGEAAGYSGCAAPVSAEGKVGAVVKSQASPQVRLAWGGKNYLAVYGSTEIYSLLLSPEGKPLNPSQYGNEAMRCKSAAFSVSMVPEKGWLVVGQRSPPDPWGWGGPGAMRCAVVTPEGKMDNPTAKEPDGNWDKLANWLDVGGRGRTTWPWGESASVWDGKHSVVVWPRHHICGEKKSSFANCDLIASRVDGWKPLDAAGVPVAATGAEEDQPGLASSGPGALLMVYEKSEGGKTMIAARTISSQ
jgi:hypothetical protein